MRDGAQRTRIGTFHGTSFVAEREGEDLCIYMLSDEPLPTNTLGDAKGRRANRCTGMSAEKLQAQIIAHRVVRNDQ
jgi:hypothetical protein